LSRRAEKAIENADAIVGGKRHVDDVETSGKDVYVLTKDLDGAIEFIKGRKNGAKVAVLVSGDPGFYSFLPYLKKHLPARSIKVIPGLSSLQYMFASIGLEWQDAYLGSVHGRFGDIIALYNSHKKVALLTDRSSSPVTMAEILCENGYGDAILIVGENLSYDNERIVRATAAQIRNMSFENLSVVVILHE